MPKSYERSIAHHFVQRKGHPEPAPLPLCEVRGESVRCLRPHCGGLMLRRAVVTVDGTCEEYVCASCSRSALIRIVEPYPPLPIEGPLTRAIATVPRTPASRARAAPDSDGSEDSVLPPEILAVLRPDTEFDT
jgi:hypothetical protein